MGRSMLAIRARGGRPALSRAEPARYNPAMTQQGDIRVGIVMGSRSDWPTMEHAADVLEDLEVPYETRVVSAHRTPDLLFEYAAGAADRGLRAIIAGAGGAAHLPGMLAAKTWLPVLGVPVQSRALSGMDSLLSIAQMPGGVPVGTLAIGNAGAKNAGLLAAAMLATTEAKLRERLEAWRARQTADVLAHPDPAVGAGKPRGTGGS